MGEIAPKWQDWGRYPGVRREREREREREGERGGEREDV